MNHLKTGIPTRSEFHKEFAGEIYSSDFDTEGKIYSRSSKNRQRTYTELYNFKMLTNKKNPQESK